MMGTLKELLLLKFNHSVVDEILADFNRESFSKSALVVYAGTPVRHLYFIEGGLLRSFYIDASGTEHTFDFYGHGEFITILDSFLYSRASEFSIECLQPTVVLKISKERLDKLIHKYPVLNDLRFELLAAHNQKNVSRSLFHHLPTARERFSALLVRFPRILEQCKKKHIASYLQLTKESFSRFLNQ